MKLTVTKRDRVVLFVLLGILAVAISWFVVHNNYDEKTKKLKETNKAIQSRVDVLQSIADQQAELANQINENNAMIETILSRFPSNIYEEDIILFARALEDFAPFESLPNVGIGGPSEAYRFQDITAQTDEQVNGYIPEDVAGVAGSAAAEEEGAQDPAAGATDTGAIPVLYSRGCTVAGLTDYDGFKNAIRFVVDNLDRSNMTVNASYDINTGMLQASFNIGRYYVTGTDKAYVEPEIRGIIQGTDNIFGTVPIKGEMRSPVRRTGEE